MTASQAFTEMAARQIALVSSFDGRVWTASADEYGQNFSSKSRKVKQLSAHGTTPVLAIRNLCVLLDSQPKAKALFDSQAEEKALFNQEAPF